MNYRSASAPAGQSAMHNMLLSSSRSLSLDSAIARACHAQAGSGNSNAIFAPATDCNSVLDIIAHIHASCNDQALETPEQECYQLAQLANDGFYRVVIAGNGGIPVIVRAMQSFPESEGLQECSCLALANLYNHGTCDYNSRAVQAAGGLRQIIVSMAMHPTSVAVQSAACEALRTMSASIETLLSNDPEAMTQLMHVLSHAKTMYLPNRSATTAEKLLLGLVRSALLKQRC